MKVLELFAGTRSIGKAFERNGHEVYSIDEILDRYYNEVIKDFIRLRLEAGEFVTGDDDMSAYPDVFDKYNI